jgi:hypothetical protein
MAYAPLNAVASIPPKVWLFIGLAVLAVWILSRALWSGGASGITKIGDSVGRATEGAGDVVDVLATGVAPWRASEETVSANPLLRPFFNFGYWLSKPGGLFD